jgi:mutator protein MutT
MSDGNSPRVRVVAAVVWRAGRVLLCQRPLGKEHGGQWEFPGGKVEPGETLPQAVTRELEEELDVPVIAVGPPLWECGHPRRALTLIFLPTEIRGEPRCVEHQALSWETPEGALELPLAPLDRAFVETVLIPQTETTLS